MTTVSEKIRTNFQELDSNRELSANTWQMLKKPGTDEVSGRIRIRIGSSELARNIQNTIHSLPISVGGELVAISVHNACLQELPKCNLGK